MDLHLLIHTPKIKKAKMIFTLVHLGDTFIRSDLQSIYISRNTITVFHGSLTHNIVL